MALSDSQASAQASEWLSDPFLGTRQAPGWQPHMVGSGSHTTQPASPSWPPSTAWPPGTIKHGTMETPRPIHSYLPTPLLPLIYNSGEERTSRKHNKRVNTEMIKWQWTQQKKRTYRFSELRDGIGREKKSNLASYPLVNWHGHHLFFL